ncbi:hypothetical protein BG015_003582 [Linnemannia schmuckeri]|uniref:Uncharacterized protein n=1 Tax=Linnemannia schmuckeri TaxID=64567 RepID=A0A9P5S724_9FUNG|nr:hypothetical protein BG015_003582 [Linnemannia schmuckeri]
MELNLVFGQEMPARVEVERHGFEYYVCPVQGCGDKARNGLFMCYNKETFMNKTHKHSNPFESETPASSFSLTPSLSPSSSPSSTFLPLPSSPLFLPLSSSSSSPAALN